MSTATPSTTTMVPLGDVARFIRGITFKPDDKVEPGTAGSAVCMRTKNVQADLDLDDLIAVPDDFVKRDEQFLNETDILVSTANSWELVGKCSWVPSLSFVATAGGFISILRANPERIHPRYLYYWFSSSSTQHYVRHCGRQTTNISNMSYERCLALEIPLPPLSEQKRIADILDKADAIRRKRQEALQANADVIYSVYQEWFGNPITNPKGYPTKKINDLCNLVRGSSPRPKSDPRFYGGPVPRLMVEDITRDGRLVTPKIDSLTEEGAKKSRPCKAETVVMVVSGNVGLPAKLAIDACIHDGFVGLLDLDTTTIRSDFLVLTLEMLKVTHERFKAGAIWQNLTTHQIKAMEIPLPPLEDQDAFDRFVRRHQEFTGVLQKKASEETDLFNSLVQRAFKGEL